MSLTPGLGAFNKDKVANKFGIQLKGKDAPTRSTTEKKPTTPETPTVTKNKTISDFRTDKNTNGFLTNTKPSEATKKSPTSKSTSGLVNTSIDPKQQSNSLTSTNNHSKIKSKESSSSKSLSTINRTPSPSAAKKDAQKDQPLSRRQSSKQLEQTTAPKNDAQKDQPLSRRQSSKQLEQTTPVTPSPAPPTKTTTTMTSLKR